MKKSVSLILKLVLIIVGIVWFYSVRNSNVNILHTSNSPTEMANNPDNPCLNDPLLEMALVSSGSSGLSGGLFGCRRNGRNNCSFSGYGDKPKRHRGIDLKADIGTPIYAIEGGKVIHVRTGFLNNECNSSKAHGNRIIVKSNINGEDYNFFYCHLSTIDVSDGDTVIREQLIGESGTSGNACRSIPHLHIEVQKSGNYYDPEEFMTSKFNENGAKTHTCR